MKDAQIDAMLDAGSSSHKVRSLLECSVGRILRRDARKGIAVKPTNDELRHVVDWLVASELSDAYWISRTDDAGRPLKLMKLGSIAACVAEADKAMFLDSQRFATTTLGPDDERMEWDCGDGYAMVRLLTPAALDLESSRMGHCIGGGAYDGRLSRRDFCYLSLRSPNGLPHVTLEIEDKKGKPILRQSQGRSNRYPVISHRRRIAVFLLAYGIEIPKRILENLIVDEEGNVKDPSDPGTVFPGVTGSLDISGDAAHRLTPGMTIEGDLRISNSDIARLPDGIVVKETLTIEDCPNIEPSSLACLPRTRRTILKRCGITKFTDVMGRSFDLEGHPPVDGLYSLSRVEIAHPLGVRSNGRTVRVANVAHVDIESRGMSRCEIKDCGSVSFSRRFSASYLKVVSSKVAAWPENLEVVNFKAHAAGMTGIPTFSRSIRSIDIEDEPHLSRLAGDWPRVSIDIRRSGIVSITAKKTRALSIVDCDLASLPEDLHVKGDLLLENLPMKKLPGGLRVDGNLFLKNLPIDRIPADTSIKGSLVVTDCPIDLEAMKDRSFPYGLTLKNCGLESLPEGFTVSRGSLVLSGNPIRALPSGLRIGAGIDLRNTRITRLPSDARIGGHVMFGPVADGEPVSGKNSPDDFLWAINRPMEENDISKALDRLLGRRKFEGAPENGPACRWTILDSSGRMHRIDRPLPEDLHVAGDLEIGWGRVGLPGGAFVDGSITLYKCLWKRLPDGLRIAGDLTILWDQEIYPDRELRSGGMNHVSTIGEIDVGGSIDIQFVPGLRMPEELHVKGDLKILGCRKVSLPGRLVVDGNAFMDVDDLMAYEGEMLVAGDLWLDGGPGGPLPSGIVVHGRTLRSKRQVVRTAIGRAVGIPSRSAFIVMERAANRLLGRAGTNFMDSLRPSSGMDENRTAKAAAEECR
jgi:hypothetical protein